MSIENPTPTETIAACDFLLKGDYLLSKSTRDVLINARDKEANIIGYEDDAFVVVGHDKEKNTLQVALKGEIKTIEVNVEFEFTESEEK